MPLLMLLFSTFSLLLCNLPLTDETAAADVVKLLLICLLLAV
jgi:hypothetical protein